MQNSKCKIKNGRAENTPEPPWGQLLFGHQYRKDYHQTGFCVSKRLPSFCILHFEFCIPNAPPINSNLIVFQPLNIKKEDFPMLQGLAIWHYPHRSMVENIYYFAALGLDSVSVHGAQFVNAIADPATAEAIAAAVRETGVVFTVHYCLPRKHEPAEVAAFEAGIRAIANWQSAHGSIAVLSFDVPQPVRSGVGIGGYLDLVLNTVPACKVAVEDFGLNATERAQIAHLKDQPRFGYLVDVGHLFLRLCGRNDSGKTLFTNAPDEYPVAETPDCAVFKAALASKEFPIFEMHLHNNDGADDVHWFLEQGEMNVPAVAQALRELGFDGVLTVESAPGFRFECRGKDADEGIMRTLAYWKECCEA